MRRPPAGGFTYRPSLNDRRSSVQLFIALLDIEKFNARYRETFSSLASLVNIPMLYSASATALSILDSASPHLRAYCCTQPVPLHPMLYIQHNCAQTCGRWTTLCNFCQQTSIQVSLQYNTVRDRD